MVRASVPEFGLGKSVATNGDQVFPLSFEIEDKINPNYFQMALCSVLQVPKMTDGRFILK